MFGFGKPRCPIDDETRAWVDALMDWFIERFGVHACRHATMILPTTEFFPDKYEPPTEERLHVLFQRMCGFLNVATDRAELQYFEEKSATVDSSSGLMNYGANPTGFSHQHEGKHQVWLNVLELDDALAVVATMARELALSILLDENELTREDEDHREIAELFTVFKGLGVLTANAVLRDREFSDGVLRSWSVGRQSSLPMPVFGYALARFASHRNEFNPAWAKHLRLDVRSPFKASQRYLMRL